MKPVTTKQQSRIILYDADALAGAGAELFDPEHWRSLGALTGTAPGRGSTFFIDAPFGRAALRRYLRGGWAAKFSHDRYLYTGAQRSRPFRDCHLLRCRSAAGLRVPEPLAALCERSGLSYRGALLTRRIEAVEPLAGRLEDPGLDWRALGASLRAFHEAGVEHADLTARNILLQGGTGRVWLLDFDRSGYTPGRRVNGQGNLARLRRSLAKLWPGAANGLERAWAELLEGYGG